MKHTDHQPTAKLAAVQAGPAITTTAPLPPRVLLTLMALLEQDCSPIELDELLGVPGRSYDYLTVLRSRVRPGLISSHVTDSHMRYRITDRAEAKRLLNLAEPEHLAAARQRLDAHFNSDADAPDMKALLGRAMARVTLMRTAEAAAAKRKKKAHRNQKAKKYPINPVCH